MWMHRTIATWTEDFRAPAHGFHTSAAFRGWFWGGFAVVILQFDSFSFRLIVSQQPAGLLVSREFSDGRHHDFAEVCSIHSNHMYKLD
jgi:hypothetical protein